MADLHDASVRGELRLGASLSIIRERNANPQVRADDPVVAREKRRAATAKILAPTLRIGQRAAQPAARSQIRCNWPTRPLAQLTPTGRNWPGTLDSRVGLAQAYAQIHPRTRSTADTTPLCAKSSVIVEQ